MTCYVPYIHTCARSKSSGEGKIERNKNTQKSTTNETIRDLQVPYIHACATSK